MSEENDNLPILAATPPPPPNQRTRNRPTTFLIAPHVVIDVKDVYSQKLLSICFWCQYSSIIMLYLTMFFTLPTRSIFNRPAICVNASILTLYAVFIAMMLLPYGMVEDALPNDRSYRVNFLITVLFCIALILNITSTVFLFQMKEPLLLEFQSDDKLGESVDFTQYLHVLTITVLILVLSAFILSLMNTIINGIAIHRIANRIARKNDDEPLKNSLEGATYQNGDLLIDQKYLIDNEIHNEILRNVNNAF